MTSSFPLLRFPEKGSDAAPRLGHRLVDGYLELVAARLRPNSTLAVAYDLKVFFAVVAKDPVEVRRADVLAFVRAQRSPKGDGNVVRFSDGSAGLASSTVRRRLSSVSGLYSHLVALGEMSHNPVPRGMPVRAPVSRGKRVVPLVRPVRHLPRVLDPTEVTALLGGLRTHRDRAIVEAELVRHLIPRWRSVSSIGPEWVRRAGRPAGLRGRRLAISGRCRPGSLFLRRRGAARSGPRRPR
jgi:hypothetical protein